MSLDLLGPANAQGSTTVRPTDSRVFGVTDTWFNPCSSDAARDGTRVQAVFLNGVLAQLRQAIRGQGVPEDNTDTMLLTAIKGSRPLYAVDTGIVNSLVLAPAVTVPALYPGLTINAKVKFTNTGAAVAQVSALTAIPIYRPDGSALQGGELPANNVVQLVSDGTSLLLASSNVRPALYNARTFTGTANALAAACSPTASPALSAGDLIVGVIGTTNTASAVTMTLDSGSTYNIVRPNSAALAIGDLPAGDLVLFRYDGVNIRALADLTTCSQIGASGPGYSLVIDETYSSGTGVANPTSGTWYSRALNTILLNAIGATLSAGQVTLPAGTYELWGEVTGNTSESNALRIQSRIRNITAGTTLGVGNSSATGASTNMLGYARSDVLVPTVTFAAPTTIAVQAYHVWGGGWGTLGGYAVTSGEIEVFARFRAKKLR